MNREVTRVAENKMNRAWNSRQSYPWTKDNGFRLKCVQALGSLASATFKKNTTGSGFLPTGSQKKVPPNYFNKLNIVLHVLPLETLLSPINSWSRILIRLEEAIFVGEGKTVIETLEAKPRGGGGGDSYMKQTGMLAVLPRGAIIGFWSRLGRSGQSANILSHQGLV